MAKPVASILDELRYVYYCTKNSKQPSRDDYEKLVEAYSKGTVTHDFREVTSVLTYKEIYADMLKGTMNDLLHVEIDKQGYGSPTTYSHRWTLHIMGVIHRPNVRATCISCKIEEKAVRIRDQKGDGFKIKMLNQSALKGITDKAQVKRIESQIELSHFVAFYAGIWTHRVTKITTEKDQSSQSIYPYFYSSNTTIGDKIIKVRPKDSSKKWSPINSIDLDEWFIKLELPTTKKDKDDKSPNPEKILNQRVKIKVIDPKFIVYERDAKGQYVRGPDGKFAPAKDSSGAVMFKPYTFDGEAPNLYNIHKIITPGSAVVAVIDMSTSSVSGQGNHLGAKMWELLLSRNTGGTDKIQVTQESLSDELGIDLGDMAPDEDLEDTFNKANTNAAQTSPPPISQVQQMQDGLNGIKLEIPLVITPPSL